ncbi:cytochrome c [Massilia sp. IC2-477]|uniref:c-type cytochrome n=1 Tax=unclassified Massilia TaxID=2609279 RepID=UPI001D1288D0|nr:MULTISPECIES: cytochrome c [unclassified Massilia]MCC2956744.1 cytochrome c [Massilia sp. IC2-477]MCC2973160.1 cytochrome c [Massilia sp. IC2-476]
MKKLVSALVVGAFCLNASAADVAKGEALVKKYNCASCHGADYNKPIDPTYPKLAGQHPEYLAHALRAYKRGAGSNGRANPIMAGQVQPLSNRDMADIGAYLGSLPSNLVVSK